MKQVSVTVLMPAYNAEKYIAAAIASVLEQSFEDFELLIVDDGSTDNTLEVVRQFQDSRIRVCTQPNKGVAAALNAGLKLARGIYIARFDADDICLPQRLARQLSFLEQSPEYLIVGCDAEYITEEGTHLFDFRCAGHTHQEIAGQLYQRCPFIHSGVMYRKDAVQSIGGYSPYAHNFEDHLLWARLLKKGKCCNLPLALIKVRINPDSVTIDEKWRGRKFRLLKKQIIRRGDITKDEGDELSRIITRQDRPKIKRGAYHALCGKKFLVDNYKPGEARKHIRAAIQYYPTRLDNYILLLFSYLPFRLLKRVHRQGIPKSFVQRLRKAGSILKPEERRRFGMLLVPDLIINVADIGFLAALLWMVRQEATPVPVWELILFFLLFSLKNLAGFLVFRAQHKALFNVATRISSDKLTEYQEGDYRQYSNTGSPAHIRAISYQPLEFCQHVLGGVLQAITQAMLVLLSVIGILFYNARLFVLLLLLLLPPLIAVLVGLKRKMRRIRSRALSGSELSLQRLQEALAGYVEGNIYGKNRQFLEKYLGAQKIFNASLSDQQVVQAIPARTMEIFSLLGIVLLLMINQWKGNTGHAAFLTIGVFMAAAYKIIPGIVKLLNLGSQISAYSFTIDGLVSKEQDLSGGNVVQRPESLLPASICSLGFHKVSFSFGQQLILDELSFSIQSGDLVGITGVSGKGKTTMLNLLLGFFDQDEGVITINGVIRESSERRRYFKNISYVKQQAFLLQDSLLHNITLDGGDYDESRLTMAIRIAGLQSLIAASTEGLGRMVTEGGKNLSGGQRQRIAIARALYKDPDLLILDEPFNELDEASEDQILAHLAALTKKGKLIILITHSSRSLLWCNKLVQAGDNGGVQTDLPSDRSSGGRRVVDEKA